MVRVFVPTTLQGLRDLGSQGFVAEGGVAAAVTPGLRALPAASGADAEELEYLALRIAAAESLRLLAGRGAGAGPDGLRRVVLAADVPPAEVGEADVRGPGLVRLGAAVPRDRVAAVFVDEPSASAAVQDAVASGGTSDAMTGVELLWYATQEIPDLLR